MQKYDAIIIGAGPAGSTAAKIIATAGKSCIVIEKQKDFSNRKCAGAINAIQALLFEIDFTHILDAAINSVKGSKIYSPDGNFIEIPSEDIGCDVLGYVLDRDKFDELLARDAEETGVELVMGEKIISREITKKDKYFRIILRGEEISAKYLIDASGFASIAGKRFGVTSTLSHNEYCICLQYTIKSIVWGDNEFISLYLGNNIAPFGYAWIFPVNEDTIRVGLGIQPKSGNLKKYLNTFLQSKNINGEIINTLSAPIPLSKLGKTRKGNLFVIGDAGRFCDPCSGGGIISAIVSGRIAGEAVIADNPKVFDWEIKPLKRILRRRWLVREFIYEISDEKMNRLVGKMKRRRFTIANRGRELIKLF